MRRKSESAIVICLCLAIASCEETPFGSDLSEIAETGLNHHRPGHGGGGGGEDPPAAGFTLTMTGGIVTGPVATTMNKETKRSLDLVIPSAQFALAATHAAAIDEITNPANPVCEYRPASMPLATKQVLASELVANRGAGGLVINKFEDLGNVVYNRPTDGGHWTSWGFNTQTDGQQAADVTYDGTDKQDAGSTRNFRLSGGVIRVLDPDIGDLVCFVQDEMLAVVSPGTP